MAESERAGARFLPIFFTNYWMDDAAPEIPSKG